MPLLGMTEDGEIYEQNSVRNDGKGISYFPTFSDEGNVLIGEEDPVSIRNRHAARQYLQQAQRKARAHNRKETRRLQKIDRSVAALHSKRRAAQQSVAAHATHRASNAYLKARKQYQTSEDFSPLLGNVDEGFASPSVLVGDLDLCGQLNGVMHISDVDNHEGFLQDFNLHDEPTKVPTVRMTVGMAAHPMALFAHPAIFYGDSQMGWNLFKAIGKAVTAPFKVTAKVTKAIVKGTVKVAKVSTKIIGKTISEPIKLSEKVIKKIPIIGDIHKGVNKLAGGAHTSMVSLMTLPGDAMQGKRITKQRLIGDLVFAAKIGAVVISGGSAAAIIGVSSGLLKNGPLGQTKLGRALLTVGEVAGFATAGLQAAGSAAGQAAGQTAGTVATQAGTQAATQAGSQVATQVGTKVAEQTVQSAITNALIKKGQDVVQQKAIELVASKTGVVGKLVATAALNDPSKLSYSSLSKIDLSKVDPNKITGEQVLAYAETAAKARAAKEFEARTGVPVGAAFYVQDVVTGKKKVGTIPDDITKKVSSLQLEAKNLSPADQQAHISNNAKELNVKVAESPDLALSPEKRESNAAAVHNAEALKVAAAEEKALKASQNAEVFHALLDSEIDKLTKLKDEYLAASDADKQKILLAFQTQLKRVLKIDADTTRADNEAVRLIALAELAKAQGALRVAAAEEGRYWPGYEFSHPMLQLGLIPRIEKKKAV